MVLVLTAASIKCCFDSLNIGRLFFMKEFKLYPLNRKLPLSHSASANLTSLLYLEKKEKMAGLFEY